MAIPNEMRIPVAAASLVVIALSLFLSLRGCREPELAVPQPEALDAWAVSMAEAVDGLLPDGGDVVLASWNTDVWSAPARKAQRDGFLDAIKRHKKIRILAEERYIPPPENPFFVALDETTLGELSQKYGDADLLVSLVGLPAGDESAMGALKDSLPPILCTTTYLGPSEQAGLDSGLVAGVVMPSGGDDGSYELKRPGEL